MSTSSIELIARGVLWDADKLLLCRNRKHGHLFLPGGHVEFGERAADALEREMREEIGVDLAAGRFLGATEGWFEQPNRRGELVRHHEVNLVFDLNWPDGAEADPTAIVSRESGIAFEWFRLTELVGSNARGRLLPESIATLIADPETRWVSDWQ